MGAYTERLDVPPTYPRSYSAGSRLDKKLTGLTVPRKFTGKIRVTRDGLRSGH